MVFRAGKSGAGEATADKSEVSFCNGANHVKLEDGRPWLHDSVSVLKVTELYFREVNFLVCEFCLSKTVKNL